MNQEQLHQLIYDSFELHCYGDMSEISDFLEELAEKYDLYFDKKVFNVSPNAIHYINNINYSEITDEAKSIIDNGGF